MLDGVAHKSMTINIKADIPKIFVIEIRPEIMEQCPRNWDEYFWICCPDVYAFSQQDNLPPEFLPASTKELSQPLTCLYAM
jgi:hypothetical protein